MTKLAFILVLIGALNWGLVGALNFDLVEFLMIDKLQQPIAASIVYVVVGLSGLLLAVKKIMMCCKGSCKKK